MAVGSGGQKAQYCCRWCVCMDGPQNLASSVLSCKEGAQLTMQHTAWYGVAVCPGAHSLEDWADERSALFLWELLGLCCTVPGMILSYVGENLGLTAKQISSAQEDGHSLSNSECGISWSSRSAERVTNVFFACFCML